MNTIGKELAAIVMGRLVVALGIMLIVVLYLAR
jgi:hypothetical protein